MKKNYHEIIEKLINEDNYVQALIHCGKAFRINQNDSFAIEKAKFIINRITEAHLDMQVKTAEDFTNRGIAFFYSEQLEQALEDFKSAIEIDSKFDYAWKSRSLVYFIKKQFKLAENDIRKAIELYPCAEYFNDLGNILSSQNPKNHESIDCYIKATQLNPNSELYWYNYAVDLGEKGKLQVSLNAFNKALEINPNYEDAQVNRDYLLKLMDKSK